MMDGLFEAFRIGFGFLWTAAWAIIMGLTITSFVQVYVSKERMAQVLGDGRIGERSSLMESSMNRGQVTFDACANP